MRWPVLFPHPNLSTMMHNSVCGNDPVDRSWTLYLDLTAVQQTRRIYQPHTLCRQMLEPTHKFPTCLIWTSVSGARQNSIQRPRLFLHFLDSCRVSRNKSSGNILALLGWSRHFISQIRLCFGREVTRYQLIEFWLLVLWPSNGTCSPISDKITSSLPPLNISWFTSSRRRRI